MTRSLLCRIGLHKWGFDHRGIRICTRNNCDAIDRYHGHWGTMRLNYEKGGAPILTNESARKHWNDLENWRLL